VHKFNPRSPKSYFYVGCIQFVGDAIVWFFLLNYGDGVVYFAFILGVWYNIGCSYTYLVGWFESFVFRVFRIHSFDNQCTLQSTEVQGPNEAKTDDLATPIQEQGDFVPPEEVCVFCIYFIWRFFIFTSMLLLTKIRYITSSKTWFCALLRETHMRHSKIASSGRNILNPGKNV
jgi:hypothetical protein